jgi:hypothetical protein
MALTAPIDAFPGKSREAGLATTFFACFLSMSAPLMTYVLLANYGFDAVEAWAAFALVAAFAALYTAVHRAVRPIAQRGLEVIFIILLADLYIDNRYVPTVIGMAWLVLGFFLKSGPHRFLVPFGGAALLTSAATSLIDRKPWLGEVADPIARARGTESTKPAIVHIIFDEHIGLSGLPQTPQGQETARTLQVAYRAHGFTTYERAYSRHFHTINAVPDILNFGRRLGLSGDLAGGITGPTDYLAGLREEGYALTIYQSSFLDLCSGADEKLCVTYDRGNLQPASEVGLSSSDRLQLLMATYLGASRMLTIGLEYYRTGNFGEWAKDRPMPQGFKMLRDSWSIAGLRAMERVVDDLRQARPGNAYFIHAMLPHYPYVATRDCAVKPVSQWRPRKDERTLAERQEAYYDQLHCSMRYIDRIIAQLNASPAGGNVIIIVHGDHGSRIVDVDPVAAQRGKIEKDEMIASYSTLFAVRLPGQQPRNHAGFASAPAILHALAQNDFKTAPEPPGETRPTVVLDDMTWKPTRPMALPTDW